MKKYLPVLALAVLLFLTGCHSQTVKAQFASQPTIPATEAITKPPDVVDYCASCHTDKEQLISTAKPEEIVEKESSGAG